MRNDFTLRLYAYSGCNPIPQMFETRSEARDGAARALRRARNEERICSIIEAGAEWEITGHRGATTVDDEGGTLRIRPPLQTPCKECGFDFAPETADDRGDGVPTIPRGRWYQCADCVNPPEPEDEPETVGARHVCGRDC